MLLLLLSAVVLCPAAQAATHTPLPISDAFYNASVLADQGTGWFERDEAPYDLSALPTGTVALADTTYAVHALDEAAIMLAGTGTTVSATSVTNLPVGRAADELRFLHTWNPGPALQAWRQQIFDVRAQRGHSIDPDYPPHQNMPEPLLLFTYVVHYQDGEQIPVKVRWGEGIHDWLREEFTPQVGFLRDLALCEVAWTAETGDVPGRQVVLYSMRWPNPRPGKLIDRIDIVSEGQDYGAPAVLAVTTVDTTSTGDTYYVAPPPAGSNTNPGTYDSPWATPEKAASTLTAGDTVYFRAGRYTLTSQFSPANSGNSSAWITYAGFPGEKAIIDGVNLSLTNTQRLGVMHIANRDYIRVHNLHVENSSSQGIVVSGTSDHVDVLNCTIFFTANTGLGSWRSTVESCRFIRFIGNQLFATCSRDAHVFFYGVNQTPGDECLDAGGTADFEYAYNEVGFGDKESIDCKGPCRRGEIHHNYVYGTGSIYVDAWNEPLYDLDLHHNVSYECFGGYKLSTEYNATADNITFRNNLAVNEQAQGFHLTSYGEQYAVSDKSNINVLNNTFVNCNFGVLIEGQKITNLVVRNNLIADSRSYHIATNGQNTNTQNIVIDYNLLDEPNSDAGVFDGTVGEHAVIGDPLFWDPAVFNYRLSRFSPAVDAGHPSAAYNDPDGSRNDIGWRELGGPFGRAPGPASGPDPDDFALSVRTDATLRWAVGNQGQYHDVYFGTDPTPDANEFQGTQTTTEFIPGPLAVGTTYYWQIVETNGEGTAAGPVWRFTTSDGSGALAQDAGYALAGASSVQSASFTASSAGDPGDYLVVGAVSETSYVTSMTFGGQPMTRLYGANADNAAYVEFFGIPTAAVSGTVVANYSGNIFGTQIFGYAFLAGVDTAAPLRATGSGANASGTGSVNVNYSAAAGEGDFAFLLANQNGKTYTPSVTPSDETLYTGAAGASFSGMAAYDEGLPSGTYASAFTFNGGVNRELAGGVILRAAQIDPNADTDGDGIPDWYETAYSGSATGLVATVDGDGDGPDAYAEWIALTDPTDSNSYLRAESIDVLFNGTVVVQWLGHTSRVYGVTWQPDPMSAAQDLATGLAGLTPMTSYTDTTHRGESAGVYGVQVGEGP